MRIADSHNSKSENRTSAMAAAKKQSWRTKLMQEGEKQQSKDMTSNHKPKDFYS